MLLSIFMRVFWCIFVMQIQIKLLNLRVCMFSVSVDSVGGVSKVVVLVYVLTSSVLEFKLLYMGTSCLYSLSF